MGFGKKTEELPDLNKQAEELPDGLSPLSSLMGKNSGKRAFKTLAIPGLDPEDDDNKVSLVALRQSETQEAHINALLWIIEKKKMPEWLIASEMGQNLLTEEIQVQLLYRAMRVPGNLDKHFATSPADVRINLEPDQQVALFQEFLVFQNSRSPLKFLKTEKEMEDFVSLMLKEETTETELSFYSVDTLRSIMPLLGREHRRRMKLLSSRILCQKCSSPFGSPESLDTDSPEPVEVEEAKSEEDTTKVDE